MNERDANDHQAVTARLRAALVDTYGKLRVVDAFALAGFARPSYFRAKIVSRVMNDLGWDRKRLRFDGTLCYAYARGSQLEREVILDVEREGKDRLVVNRREP